MRRIAVQRLAGLLLILAGVCALLVALAPLPVLAEVPAARPAPDDLAVGLGRVFWALLFVVGAIVALAWAYRSMGRAAGNPGMALRVLGSVHLGNREKVVLLQSGHLQLLVGVAPGSVRLLHAERCQDEKIAESEAPTILREAADPVNPSFSHRLQHALRARGDA